MSFFSDIYEKKLEENCEQIRFWEDYINSLNDIQFKIYSDKLKVPVLVPIGSRILFRGELKHTNEVTVSLGMGYFTKCSTEQAEILRQHRIKDAKSKLEIAMKEKEYIESQIQFKNQSVFANLGQEIIEFQSEEEDRLWREKHKLNIKDYHQSKSKKEELNKHEISDEELWNRLEELELQEELENELSKDTVNDEDTINSIKNNKKEDNIGNGEKEKYDDIIKETIVSDSVQISSENTNRLELLQNILDKQKELEKKISDMKNQERNVTKTESDLMSRLDELEQLDEVEDEMDRLDDVLYEHELADEEEQETKSNANIKRSVSFADQDESETLEITFKHSDVPANKEAYDPRKGILKPSDIYDAFSHQFPETTPILRKTKYESDIKESSNSQMNNEKTNIELKNDNATNILIVVDDVHENKSAEQKILDSGQQRPMSIFKKRRQHKF